MLNHCCPVNIAEMSTALILSGRDYIYAIRDMNWNPSPETRCKYIHVRSDAASMRHTVSGNRSHFMPLTINGTVVMLNINSSAAVDCNYLASDIMGVFD